MVEASDIGPTAAVAEFARGDAKEGIARLDGVLAGRDGRHKQQNGQNRAAE